MVEKMHFSNDFLKFIPHRKPFLFVDQILEFKKNEFLFSKFKVRSEESFFLGHFPKNPIFPGIFILESMMQSAGILIGMNDKKLLMKQRKNYVTYIKHAKFYHPIFPNSSMYIKVFLLNQIKGFFKFQGYSFVNKILVCQAMITIYVEEIFCKKI
ncbi:3-hydroxyacyl-ACP dehydratase FabZ family protein [Buchnera aphidicola]|uniref:3-hydroxyacyl-ACP dehydratase FabZ family protein n=1 Tax=Buchnera aphidicola TaxID=9 RepID=UPI003464340F